MAGSYPKMFEHPDEVTYSDVAREVAPNVYSNKSPPLAWAGHQGDCGVSFREFLFHPIQWWGWFQYRRTYYKRFPAHISGNDLMRPWHDVLRVPRSDSDGVYLIPRRPEGEKSLRSRFKHGWAVFTGRADAVYWLSQ